MKKACSFVFFWKKTWSWRVVRKRFPLFIFFRSCGIVSLSTAKSMFSILNSAFFHKPLWNRTLGGCFLLEKKSSFKAKTLWKIFLIFWLIHSNTFHFDHFRMRILSFSKSFSKRFCFEKHFYVFCWKHKFRLSGYTFVVFFVLFFVFEQIRFVKRARESCFWKCFCKELLRCVRSPPQTCLWKIMCLVLLYSFCRSSP